MIIGYKMQVEINRIGEIEVFSVNGKSTNEHQLSRLLTNTQNAGGFGVFSREDAKIDIKLPMFPWKPTSEQFAAILNRRISIIESAFERQEIRK
jgi:hypothetical protein